MPPKNKKTSRIPGKFVSVQDLDDIEDDGDDDVLLPSTAGKRVLALKPLPRGKPAGKPRSAAQTIGSLSNPPEPGGNENWKSQDQGRLKMPVLFPKMTPRGTGKIKIPPSSASADRNPPPTPASRLGLGLELPPSTNRQRLRDQAAPEIEPPSTPVRRNPASRDPPSAPDLVPRPSENPRGDFNGPPVSSIFSFFDDAPASPPTAARRRQRLMMLETIPSFSRNDNERVEPVDQAPASAPGSNLDKQPTKSRFQYVTDPDLPAPLKRNLGVLMPKPPEKSGEEKQSARNIARGASANGDTAADETPDLTIADATPTQAHTATANDEPGPSSTSVIKSTRRYRFQDEIDPDLLALGTPARKMRTWADLSASPLSVSLAPPVIAGFDSPDLATWRRKRSNIQADLAATPTPTRKLKQGNIAGVPARLVLVNKRPRPRSSSSSSITPDTPPPKRRQQQQQQYQQQLGTIAAAPRLSKDEIEDLDTSLELVQRPEPSHKRPKSDIPSSPTKPVSPVRKRQRILIDTEDIIEDGPDSPPVPRRFRAPESAVPERIDDASSSGDEVAEHTNDIDRTTESGTLLLQPSQGPTSTAQSTGPRRLLGPDAMRLYFKTTKTTPGPAPASKPGMINILTHHKRIIVPKDPTPPPASQPRIGYLEKGLAETAMWWKHDAQERHKRMFTEDKPTLTSRVLVREFLRDDRMCFIKGPGENKDGKEGDVRVVVTDRAAESVTMKGMTLLYEGPWFQVRLLGEEEPYRFLIGNWRIE
ncbi:hypothetical protein Q9L58_008933 [Maublancomyces gigas]|uniref:Uncharacterized protein n=1 Tax=Discina gigas TaxID=1032678 RepID=A0ABR3G8A1_9PEZI